MLKNKLEKFCVIKWIGREFIIKSIYDKPLKYKNKQGRNGYKYLNTKHFRFDNHGIYYIIDDDMNIYIGSTITSFRLRYLGHMSKNNICESKEIVSHEHTYDILFDMSSIDDEELIRMIEQEYINYFRINDDFNVVNSSNAYSLLYKNNKNKSIKILK